MSIQIDSHKKSLSEAFVNSFGGYPIGYGVGVVILPLSIGRTVIRNMSIIC